MNRIRHLRERGIERAAALIGSLAGWWLFLWVVDRLLTGGVLYHSIFFPPNRALGSGLPEWKDLVQTLAILLGVPAAFLLWYWRDVNVRDQIAASRKDTNLREFQELQLRAAGALSTELPDHARATLQIAALHQLRSYLRGDYGTAFQRAAFELYCAVLSRPLWTDELPTGVRSDVFDAVRDVIYEEAEVFFGSKFPLASRSLQKVRVPSGIYLTNIDFSRSDLTETILRGCTFTNCKLEDTRFNNSVLEFARFESCKGKSTIFDNANVDSAEFDSVELSEAKFRKASISMTEVRRSRLSRCDFSEAYAFLTEFEDSEFLGGTGCTDFLLECSFNNVVFALDEVMGNYRDTWQSLNETGREQLKQDWCAGGFAGAFKMKADFVKEERRLLDEALSGRFSIDYPGQEDASPF